MKFILLASTFLAKWANAAFTNGPGFDPREASIFDIHKAIFEHGVTCRDIISAYITRIEHLNPIINAVTALNPEALSIADALDERFNSGHATDGSLFCIPILVKDNYDVAGMPTHAGCKALQNLYPAQDAATITALKEAGAVILGKVNMHEMALEGLTVSSVGGQTLNPYDLTRTPGGSSGGSGAAIAASFAVLATGTDTVNSLRNPASANGIFSMRPSRYLLDRGGVVPVSDWQDALGVMGRNVHDVGVGLAVMSKAGERDDCGEDEDYEEGEECEIIDETPPQLSGERYFAQYAERGLAGKRFGVLHGFYNYTESDETTPVIGAMKHMHSMLKKAGVELVDINTPIFNPTEILRERDVQSFEYRYELTKHLQKYKRTNRPGPRTFEELYDGNEFLVIPHQYSYIQSARTRTRDATWYERRQLSTPLLSTLQDEFTYGHLDAIIYPQQRNLVVKVGSPSQEGRNGLLAALTGAPVVVVPAKRSAPSGTAPLGVPIGLEIMGHPSPDNPWVFENRILGIAEEVSRLMEGREPPIMAREHVWPKCYERVPSIVPDVGGISSEYPLGVLA